MNDNDNQKTQGNREIEETKAFSPLGESQDISGDANEETKQINIEVDRDRAERCEERSAIKDYTVGSVAWRVARPLLILAISVVLVVYFGILVFHYVEDTYFAPVDAESTVSRNIEIKSGSSLSTIASVLYDQEIIRNKLVFQLYVDFTDRGSALLAGKYVLSPAMTMEEIIDILGQGNAARAVVKVTFTEGMAAEDFAATLVEKEMFDEEEKEEFLALCNDPEAFADYDFIAAIGHELDEEGADEADESDATDELDEADEEQTQLPNMIEGRKYLLEGYLFPDTYEFYTDASPKSVIIKLLNRFDQIFIEDYKVHASENNMTIDEIVTLASIIEWEGLPEDYKKVSSVFYNRLDKEMTFGSCATLRYVTGVKKLVYNDTEKAIDSPYNTYMYAGLPIGPVTNPGKKAIEAALYPNQDYIEQGYFYFRNADPETGDLVFAKTLEEHNEHGIAYNEKVVELNKKREEEGQTDSNE